MASSAVQLPTFEAMKEAARREECRAPRPSFDFLRLRCYIAGPAERSIFVLSDATDAFSAQEPYITQTGTGAADLWRVVR
jgi:hypothetical protein